MVGKLHDLAKIFEEHSTKMSGTLRDLIMSGDVKLFPDKQQFTTKDVHTKVLCENQHCTVMHSVWGRSVWFPCHSHMTPEYLIAVKGKFMVISNGVVVDLEPPDAILIPPETMHITCGLETGCEMVAVCVPSEKVLTLFGERQSA